jgi:hypothetical protein
MPRGGFSAWGTALCAASAFWLGACGSPSAPTPQLSISAVSPNTGSITGGTQVVVTGVGFADGATVTLGGAQATSIVVKESHTIEATTAAHAAGAVDVAVTSGGRAATLTSGFTFVAPSGANRPPVISDIRSVGSRPSQPSGFADIGETLSLTATVTDAETSPGALTYSWRGPGTFSGSGATVSWQAPNGLATPTDVTISLEVVEEYTENGVVQRNRSAADFSVQLHDSQKEILDAGEDFLVRFSQSQFTPDEVLHNFSTTCDGGSARKSEYEDTALNRRDFLQLPGYSVVAQPPVTFNFGGRCPTPKFQARGDACSKFRVHWNVQALVDDPTIGIRKGQMYQTDGFDHVTAIFENNSWRLCYSIFEGIEKNLTLGTSRYVVR